ncbi:MAG: hypothetical protein IJP98_03745 [Clostridia bacterium]|nr:hypothetical protein [Clostridia bacterium]
MADKEKNNSMLTDEGSIVVVPKNKQAILEYISSLVNGFDQQEQTDSALAQRFYQFYTRTVDLFNKYSKDPYSIGAPWGEEVFLSAFGYFDDHATYNNSNDVLENDNTACLQYDVDSGETYLRVNGTTSINILLNNHKMELMSRKLNEIAENPDKESYLLRKLIAARSLTLRKVINDFAQFTYAGERYVATRSALKDDLKTYDGNYINAIPFQHAQSLSRIDSARLIEKIWHQIAYKKKYKNAYCRASNENVILIAAFGSFSDDGKLNIEALAKDGFFRENKDDPQSEQYDVKVVHFKLKSLNAASIDFVEDDESIPFDKRITGNLHDVNFLKRVTDKYDITCLLDMGCFYSDTCRGIDFSKGSPYEDVLECIRIINVQKDRNGSDGVDILSYENLYKSYLKWIEFTFYGENHQYEFDPRLFATLVKLKQLVVPGRSVFTYLSRSRGEALKKKFQYNNLCRTEYYQGIALTVYDWRRTEKNEFNLQSELFSNVCNAEYKNKLSFRFWKMLKSIDDYFYTNGFLELYHHHNSQGLDENEIADLDFIKFCCETVVEFDYSYLNSKHTVFYSIISKYDKENSSVYLDIANRIIRSVLKIVFDRNCYDKCSTWFCKNILANAIIADAETIEHLMFSYMILAQKLQSDFVCKDVICDQKRYSQIKSVFEREETDPLLIARRHSINHVFMDAISSINSKPYRFFSDARNELYYSVEGYIGNIEPSMILKKFGTICERIGFNDCTIAVCCK